MLDATLTLFTVLFVTTTLLQCWRYPKWWVRDFDFPRVQLAALIGVLLVTQLAAGWHSDWHLALIAATAACLAYQFWWIMPYTRLHPKEVAEAPEGDGARIRIMAANVLTPNHQAERLLELVRAYSPDVLVLVETDQWWDTQLSELKERYPYNLCLPLDNLYGMHLFSRLELEDPQIRFLVQEDIPSMHARVRVSPELAIRMHFLHPAPPSPTENEESTQRDVELLKVARSVSQSDEPIIVTGDLNDVAWSSTTRLFRKISGLLDPRIGRGMFNTFHAQHWFLRWPLDHFFHSHHFKLVRIVRLPEFGSDHFPMFIELQFDPQHATEQHGLEPDSSDRQHLADALEQPLADKQNVPNPGTAKNANAPGATPVERGS